MEYSLMLHSFNKPIFFPLGKDSSSKPLLKKELLPSTQNRTERSFRNARPICFIAAKDEFDPLGSSIYSEKK
jgi:hypothetical protein